jgi:chromosome segregation ATPase
MAQNERAADVEVRLALMERSIGDIVAMHAKLEDIIRKYSTEDFRNLHERLTDVDKSVRDYTLAKIDALNVQLKRDMQALAQELRGEMQSAIDGLDKRVKEANTKIDKLAERTLELSGKIDLIGLQLATNAVQMEKLTESVDEIKEIVSYLKGVWNTIKIAGPCIIIVVSAVKWVLEHPDIIAKFLT